MSNDNINNEKKEYKSSVFTNFEYKIDEEKGIFEGYASTFGNKDAGNDIVEKGAFKKTIKEFKKRVKVLWQHNSWSPIGRPIEMKEDSTGLFTASKISMTTLGKDVLQLMKDKVITELSIGYDVIKNTMDEDGTRHLTELKLWEFSPVTWAMNEQAAITSAKSDQNLETMLFSLNDKLIKEGRILSSKNKKLIKDAIGALEALLSKVEPDDSTQKDDNQARENKNNEPDNHSLLEEIVGPLNSITSEMKQDSFADELKEFSNTLLKGGN